MTMKIKTVHIHNFRSISDASIHLHNFNLFVGANNAGKSTCLDAIRFFFALTDLSSERDKPLVVKGDEDESTWVQISFETESEAETTSWNDSLSDSSTTIRRYLKCGKGETGYRLIGKDGKSLKRKLTSVPEKLINWMGELVYVPTLSEVSDYTKFSGSSTFRDFVFPIMESALELDSNDNYSKMGKALHNFSKGFSKEKEVVAFKKAMDKALANWGANIDFSMAAPTASEIVKSMLSWTISVGGGNKRQDISAMGSGFKRQFVFTLIKTCAELKNPIGRKDHADKNSPCRRLLLFEEPESFLHPDQQAELARHLRSLATSSYQIVCTTHSAHFLSTNFEDFKSVARFRKENGITEIAQVSEKDLNTFFNAAPTGPTRKQPKADVSEIKYLLLLNPTRCGAFFAENVLMVEGTSEEALINAMLSDGTLTLPSGTFVLECLGKFNMPRLMFLLDKFKIRHSLLLDRDKSVEQRKWNAFVERSKTASTCGIEYCDSDLEEELGLQAFSGDKWQKPIDLLLKYKANTIPNIKAFCHKIESLCSTRVLSTNP